MWEKQMSYVKAIFGTLIFAAGMNLFIVPIGLYSGGFLGASQLIRTFLVDYFKLPVYNIDISGIILYMINIPLLILAYRHLGRVFFIKTILCVTAQTIFLTVIPSSAKPILEDPLAAAMVGGIIAGYGSALTLRNGGSGGGQDILGLYMMKRSKDFSVGKLSMLVNLLVYGICAVMYNLTIVIYSLIYVAVYSLIMDRCHTQNQSKAAMVITKNPEILSKIHTDMNRSATCWDAYGSYTHQPVQVIYTALSGYEAMQLQRMLKQMDPEAFVVFSTIDNVYGKFDKHL